MDDDYGKRFVAERRPTSGTKIVLFFDDRQTSTNKTYFHEVKLTQQCFGTPSMMIRSVQSRIDLTHCVMTRTRIIKRMETSYSRLHKQATYCR